jgi:P-type Ca2+ transporter type 2C
VPTPEAAWHALGVRETLARLGARAEGLSRAEAANRLARVGPNRLPRGRPTSGWRLLRDQFTSVVVALLAAAAIVSLALGERIDAAAIGVVLLLNAAIGFATEYRSRRSMEALLQFDVPQAAVVRNGRLDVVPADEIVPADVVELRPGQAVPADARLLTVVDLRVDEAALTGESVPVEKHAAVELDAATPLADRTNMVYKGTTVADGSGRAVVIATGGSTEIGRIGALVSALPDELTPLERRLDALGRRLVWFSLGVAALVGGLEALGHEPIGLVVETAIALAVAAVPEALPAVSTIALGVGLRRMARRQALVRRLPAVEALGSTTVICTDKTRTLTSGEMTVVRVWTAGREYRLGADEGASADQALRRALEVAVFASRPQAERTDAGAAGRDPVDAAIFAAAARIGLDGRALHEDRPPIGLVPFSSERKLMASFHGDFSGTVACVKGAPGRVLELCAVADDQREPLLQVNADLASAGLRVLALATGPVASPDEPSLAGLDFVGYIGLMDPPAPGVKDCIRRLRRAGLRTVMITGDQRLTAEAIGRDLALLTDDTQVIDGRELATIPDRELDVRLGAVGAFSRVTPEDKLRIVGALQRRGQIVAMLGDGVNDAPALRKADVGVAMGRRGTDVAKQAAAIVLQDDRFETIVAAVEEGRVIYENIRKFVFYLFSCNVAEIAVLLAAGLAELPPVLLPLQILYLNLVTDTLPALALAMEPADPGVMRRPPRDPQSALLTRRFLARVAGYGALITAAALAAFLWALDHDPARAATIAFSTLAFAQIFHLGTARSHYSAMNPGRALANPYAVWAVVLSSGLQVLAVHFGPLQRVLRTMPLGPGDWFVVLSAAAVPALVGQALRLRRRPDRGVEDAA